MLIKPIYHSYTLILEVGDIQGVLALLYRAGDVSLEGVYNARETKLERMRHWTTYQGHLL